MPQFGWKSESSVREWLFAEGYKFDFYQAVRLLELMFPESASVGEGSEPRHEAVQFQSNITLDFPASDVQEITPTAGKDSPARMMVNFLGIAGAHGPLPAPYTELILERVRQRDTGLRDFLDIFNHRLISLIYRLAKVHRVPLTPKSPERSAITEFLYAFLGLGLPSLRNRIEVKDPALLFYSGLIFQEPRSAAGLEHILTDYFQVSAFVKQFQGKWRELEPDQWTYLGRNGRNRALGQTATMGTRYWDQQRNFEVELGPMPLAQFLDFLPDGSAYPPLCALTRFYAGAEFEFNFTLKLSASEVPESRLGRARLGWTAWLRTGPFKLGEAQIVLRPHPSLRGRVQ